MPGGRNTQIELFLREYFDWDGVESALPFNLKADEERRVIVQFEEGRPSLSSKLISPLNIRICRHAVAPLWLAGLI